MIGPPLRPGDRVLLRLPDWLGDFVWAEPVLRALAAHVGPEHLSLAGSAHLLELLEGSHGRVRRIPHAAGSRGLARDWAGHDAALLLTGSFRSAWTAARAGIRRRIGWSRDGRGALLTDGFRPPLERGAVPLGLGRVGRTPRILPRPIGGALTELLGFVGVRVSDPVPRLRAGAEAEHQVGERLGALGLGTREGHIVVNVGARLGSAKGYGARAWIEAIRELRGGSRLPIVLVAGPGEGELGRKVSAAFSGSDPGGVLGLFDPPLGLRELLALFASARVLLTADVGPRHLAVAVGCPVVCVFGPTDPRHTADRLGRQVLLRRTVSCGPCHLERCPLAGAEEKRCMGEVPASEFAAGAAAFLE